MTIGQMLHTFAADKVVRTLLLLVVADLVFGVGAALKLGTFRLAFVADLLKKDVLFKLFPYFGIYAMSLVAGGLDLLIPGFDINVVTDTTAGLFMAAMVGSLLNSLKDLGVPVVKKLPDRVAGPEPGPKP